MTDIDEPQSDTDALAIPDNSKIIQRTHWSVAEMQGAIDETAKVIEASKAKLDSLDKPQPSKAKKP